MKASNAFEANARARKVARLASHITELVSLLGLTPAADGFLIAELVRGWGDAEWNSAAINIGKKPNSNKPLVGFQTRLDVIAHFMNAARRAS